MLLLLLLSVLRAAAIPANLAFVRNSDLGNVSLSALISPTTPEARAMFELGIKLYHLFWFDLAQNAFQEAQKRDSNLAIAYWGEALAHKAPIWHSEEQEEATRILDSIPAAAKANALEQELIHACRVYFNLSEPVGDRERKYSLEMEHIYKEHPNDADIGALYALSLLGLASDGKHKVAIDKSRRVLKEMLIKFPHHRGIMHYWTHVNDNPKDAANAIEQSRMLATLTPASTHAMHMQSHIILNFGDWKSVYTTNNNAVSVSDRYCNGVGEGPKCDAENRYHALEWRHYALLQLRRGKDARRDLDRINMIAAEDPSLFSEWQYRMFARQQILELDKSVAPFTTDALPRSLVQNGTGAAIYWKAYSESGALAAKCAQLARKYTGNAKRLDRLETELSQRFSAILDKVMDAPYIYNLVMIDLYQCKGWIGQKRGDYPSDVAASFNTAAQLEMDNKATSDSPTLPVLSGLEALGMYLVDMGGQFEAEKIFRMSDARWSYRTRPTVALDESQMWE
jgi:hypothetical protein